MVKTTISNNLLTLVAHYESLHDGDLSLAGLQPKMCPAGYWTEGYGKLVLDDKGARIQGEENKQKAYDFSIIKTPQAAEEFLARDLEDYAKRVDSLRLDIKQYQKDALISFAYNVGFAALKGSTLLKCIRAGEPLDVIESEFLRWNKAGGKVLRGLTYRRQSEAYLYINGIVKFFN